MPSPTQDARRLLAPLRQDLRRLLQSLIRTRSVAIPPSGNETPAQRLLAAFLTTHGLTPDLYDTGFLETANHPLVRKNRQYAGRFNLAASIPGTGSGRSLLLSGHMDTVPPGIDARNHWSRSPWSGTSTPTPTGTH